MLDITNADLGLVTPVHDICMDGLKMSAVNGLMTTVLLEE